MSLVGVRSDPFEFVVEASKVRELARAVYDPSAETSPLSVPPTFPMYGVAEFERHFLFDVLRLDRLRCLNAGQEYQYHRPLRIGDRLTCVGEVQEEFIRKGGNGRQLRFVVFDIEMREAATNELVVLSRATTVEVGAEP